MCEMDCPAGMSNSSFQSLSGAALELVIEKWAMKPSCHECDTDNVAPAAAASAAGIPANPTAATTAVATTTRSAVFQRRTHASNTPMRANAKARRATGPAAPWAGCGTFAQPIPSRDVRLRHDDSRVTCAVVFGLLVPNQQFSPARW